MKYENKNNPRCPWEREKRKIIRKQQCSSSNPNFNYNWAFKPRFMRFLTFVYTCFMLKVNLMNFNTSLIHKFCYFFVKNKSCK